MDWKPQRSLLLIALAGLSSLTVAAQDWSSWERQHAVGRYGAFMVVKQPGEGLCYATQSYESDPSKMTLSFKGESPAVATPFFRGIEGEPLYWVDDGDKHRVPTSDVTAVGSFKLSSDIVQEMRAGQVLYIQVRPRGERDITQEFSLRGFTAASKVLSSSECADDGGGPVSKALEVTLTRSSGGVIVSGNTVLPDGMSLMISLRASSGDYSAQDKVQVRSGSYRSATFSNRGSPLPAGIYRVSISSPLMSLQPESVRRALGSSGNGIPDEIREKSDFGESYMVRYSVSRAFE